MFGKVLSIEKNIVKIANLKGESEANILNIHVIFEENNRKILGEIVAISENDITISLVGEIKGNNFISGVSKKPSFKSSPRIIYKSELDMVLGPQDISDKINLFIGKSNIYDNHNITADINDFFSNHFAVVGNTGSGKSCGVARMLQNIFYHNDEALPEHARILIFDVYGEYKKAFTKINNLGNLRFKNFTTKLNFGEDDLLNIPTYFLEVDDIALLLDATDSAQLPVIDQMLKLVYIFTTKDEKVVQYKNDIIAKAVLDILASGKTSTQIRDQIVAVLTTYNTENFNLDTIISQPGYNRTIRQCLNIDIQGKMNAMGALVDFLGQYTTIDLDKIERDRNLMYTLDDLYYALEFALINEGTLNNQQSYERASVLKVRLQSIINSDYKVFFETDEYISVEDYIQKFFTAKDGIPAQIINMSFNMIDERFAKVLTKIFAKLFYKYVTSLQKRGSFPIHIILEEAHRFVQNDNDTKVIGYNIFDRITKEGRKYGMLLGFITQRPSELSTTSLSQCSNFIVFRMFHPEDIRIISSITANLNAEDIEKIKSLRPGSALVFGNAFKIPLIANLALPDPMPESNSVDIANVWFKHQKKNAAEDL